MSYDNKPRNYHICIFTYRSEDIKKGKLMRFDNLTDAVKFAKNLSLFMGKKIRMARDNENGNGMYFLNGESH